MPTSYAISNPHLPPLPFYVTHASINFETRPINRPKGFHQYQIMHCTQGEGTFISHEKTYQLHPGDVVIFEPSIPHKYFSSPSPTNPCLLNWMCFTVQDKYTIHNLLTPDGYCILKDVSPSITDSHFATIVNLLDASPQNNHTEISSILYKLLLDLSSYRLSLQSKKMPSHILDPVITYMKEHLKEDISIDLLSEIIQVSPSYLCRKFNQVYKTTPVRYLINLRMIKAQELLIHGLLSIGEISTSCGYHSTAYFCAEFKKNFNMTPIQYRLELTSQLLEPISLPPL